MRANLLGVFFLVFLPAILLGQNTIFCPGNPDTKDRPLGFKATGTINDNNIVLGYAWDENFNFYNGNNSYPANNVWQSQFNLDHTGNFTFYAEFYENDIPQDPVETRDFKVVNPGGTNCDLPSEIKNSGKNNKVTFKFAKEPLVEIIQGTPIPLQGQFSDGNARKCFAILLSLETKKVEKLVPIKKSASEFDIQVDTSNLKPGIYILGFRALHGKTMIGHNWKIKIIEKK